MSRDAFARRLAAILAADMAGYSRLMGIDETGTLTALKALRAEIVDPAIAAHRGKIVKNMGDGLLAEFASAVDAVQCAVEFQRALAARNADRPNERQIEFRVGINVGDIIIEDHDIFGDGVNIAARVQTLAQPGAICQTEAAYEQVRGKMPLEVEDIGAQDLKNIARPVRVFSICSGEKTPPAPKAPASHTPSIAVLPFANISGDPEQEYFVDGLTDDLITALSRWRSFAVIARDSTFTYKGRHVRASDVARDLGATYVLEGSARRIGDQLRINVRLVDCDKSHHIWAEKYDRRLENIFDVQDEITERVSATIMPELEQFQSQRAASRGTDDLSAWDFYARGMQHFYEETAHAHERAREMFRRAIEHDPGYSDAWALMGWLYARDVMIGAVEDRASAFEKGFEAAKRAVALDGNSSLAHLALSSVYMGSGNLEMGVFECERALELNPYNARAAMALGNRLDLVGRTEEGVARMIRALELSPRDPNRWHYFGFLARAYVSAGDCETALLWARRAVQVRPDQADTHYRLALCLALCGRDSEARSAFAESRRLNPALVESRTAWQPYPDKERNEKLFAGARRLGFIGS